MRRWVEQGAPARVVGVRCIRRPAARLRTPAPRPPCRRRAALGRCRRGRGRRARPAARRAPAADAGSPRPAPPGPPGCSPPPPSSGGDSRGASWDPHRHDRGEHGLVDRLAVAVGVHDPDALGVPARDLVIALRDPALQLDPLAPRTDRPRAGRSASRPASGSMRSRIVRSGQTPPVARSQISSTRSVPSPRAAPW